MMTLIIGGSSSGKSALAEQLAMEKGGPLYYLATMEVRDSDSEARVERHRNMRAGKGFQTLEIPRNLWKTLSSMELQAASTLLIECISNLVANELFNQELINDDCEGSKIQSDEEARAFADRLYQEIRNVKRSTEHLLLVTNNVFEDGVLYEAASESYLEALGFLNELLAREADEVYEVVAGNLIPLK